VAPGLPKPSPSFNLTYVYNTQRAAIVLLPVLFTINPAAFPALETEQVCLLQEVTAQAKRSIQNGIPGGIASFAAAILSSRRQHSDTIWCLSI
jgi:hypothetical protein